MAANKFKIENPHKIEEIEKAYARAKEFKGVNCPICWVTKGNDLPLMIPATANSADVYKCTVCGFIEALDKFER